MKTTKNAWLAVNLSMWFPGLGQMYAGEVGRGLFILIAQILLMGFAVWQCVAANGNALIGFFLLFGALIVHAMGLVDNYERMPDPTKEEKSPWKFALLSQTIPGLGQFCRRGWVFGLFFFVTWNAAFHLGRGWSAICVSALIAALSAGHALFSARPSPAKRDRRHIAFVFGILIFWSLRLGIPYAVNRDFLKVFFIPSESMEPVLSPGDRILVEKCAAASLKPGDLTVFHAPNKPRDVYLKRLAALSGDAVRIAKGRLWINGRMPDNPILREHGYTQMGYIGVVGAYTVPEGKIFFLGDHSAVSIDSRFFGAVDQEAVIGRAYKIIWPPRRNGPIK